MTIFTKLNPRVIFALVMMLSWSGVSFGQYLSEDFNSGLPVTWSSIDQDGATINANLTALFGTTAGWVVIEDPDSAAVGDSVLASTSWMDPVTATDDWLITPQIDLTIATAPRVSYDVKAQDPSYADGYSLKLSTTTATTAAFTTTLYTEPSGPNPVVRRTVDLSAYVGQSIYLAWHNNSTDQFYLFVDNVVVDETPGVDAEIIAESDFEYTLVPVSQAFDVVQPMSISNIGATSVTGADVTVNVYDGTLANVYSNTSSNSASILPGTSSTGIVAGTYTPVAADQYIMEYIVSINEVDGNSSNDTLYQGIIITDSTYARDNGQIAGSLGIGAGAGQNSVLGQNFDVVNADDVTGISCFINDAVGMHNQPVSGVIYSTVAGSPTSILAYTDTVIVDSVGNPNGVFLTMQMQGGQYNLPAGEYFFGILETDSNLTLGTTNDIFTLGTTFVSWLGNPNGAGVFSNSEDFNFNVTYIVRPNFGVPTGPSCTLAASASANDASANGASDGDATATVTGAQSTVTYAWSNGGTSATITGLGAGTYTVTVSDAILPGCTATASVVVNEPGLTCDLLANISVTAATTAGGSDGAAAAIVTGDQGTLTYVWSNGATTSSITGLSTNTYSFTVTDNVLPGCTATASGLVTDPSVTVACNLTASASSTDPSANGASDGTATALAAGSQGNVSYSWSNGVNTQNITGLGDGTYTVTITDDITAGCTATATVTLTEPALSCTLAIATSSNDATTNGGSDGDATVTATGDQGNITYLWSNGGATASITGLAAGTYTVTVTDDVVAGCVETASVTINEPAAVSCTLAATINSTDASTTGGSDGVATAVPTGDQGIVTYAWSNGGATASITGLTAGTYTVTVTDDIVANCEVVVTTTISEPTVNGVEDIVSETSVAIFPNPNNGTFTVKTSIDGEYTIVVRNVIGQAVNTAVLNGTMTEVALNNVTAGIYFVTIQSEGFEKTERVIVR